MAVAAEIKKEVFGRYSLLTITGSTEILIEGLRGILDYSAETVRVNTVSGIAVITGSGLEISALAAEELLLKGKISSVEFC